MIQDNVENADCGRDNGIAIMCVCVCDRDLFTLCGGLRVYWFENATPRLIIKNYSLKIGYSIEITRYPKKPLKHTAAMMIIDQNIKHKFRHHLH